MPRFDVIQWAAVAATTTLLVAAPACAKKVPPPVVTLADDDGDPLPGGAIVTEDTPAPPQGTPMQLRASVQGLDELLRVAKQATLAWTPKNPIDADAWIQAALLQFGYGPGMWNNLNLAGVTAIDATLYPQSPAQNLQLSGSLAVKDPRAVIQGMPAGRRPQPLGNGMWELLHNDVRVLLREQPGTLEFALNQADLERAGAVAKAAAGGRRLKVHATAMPPGMLPGDVIGAVIPGSLGRQVAGVVAEATAAQFELDAGTDRDVVVAFAADAPFSRLGLGPLGPARAEATKLEARMPASPALVVAIPWGDPALLQKILTNMSAAVGANAGAFGAPVQGVIKAVGSILSEVQGDVVLAIYPGARGEITLVAAAEIKDEARTRTAMRQIMTTATTSIELFNTLGGNKKDSSFIVKFSENPSQGDVLSIRPPKNMLGDLEQVEPLLTSSQTIELASVVSNGVAVLVVGGEAKPQVTNIATGLRSGRKTSLASDPGLLLARSASRGCHFCISVDPGGLMRIVVAADATTRADKKRVQEVTAAAAVATRVGAVMGLGVRLEPNTGTAALGVSQSWLTLSAADAEALSKLWAQVPMPQQPSDASRSNLLR